MGKKRGKTLNLLKKVCLFKVYQELQGNRGCLDQLAQLGPKGTMALLENLDQREILDLVDLRDLQVCLVQLEERVPRESRGM